MNEPAPCRFLVLQEPVGRLERLAWRLLFAGLAAVLLVRGMGFIAGLENQRLLSGVFFFGFMLLALRSGVLFVDLLLLLAPLFVIVPALLNYQNYSLAELGLLGGLFPLSLRGVLQPRRIISACPLTLPLVLFALLALFSTGAMLIAGNGLLNPFLPHLLANGLMRTVAFNQESVFHSFGATLNIVEGVIFFHLALWRVQTPGGRDRLLRIMTMGGALVALTAIVQHFAGWSLKSWARFGLSDYSVVNATWPDPNACVSYLLIALSAAIACWLNGPLRKWRWPLLAIPVIGVGFAFTMGRIAIIALALGLLWSLTLLLFDLSRPTVFFYKHRKRMIGVAALLLILASMAIQRIDTSQPQALSWMTAPNPLSQIVRSRLNFWRRGILLYADDPWNGVGSGRYFDQMRRYWTSDTEDWALVVRRWNPGQENAHNMFLQYFAELGVLGGSLFLLLLGVIGFRTMQAAQQLKRRGRWVNCALAGGWLALTATLLTGHALIHKEMFLLFAALAALLFHPGPADAGVWRLRKFRSPGRLAAICLLLLAAKLAFAVGKPDRTSFAEVAIGFHNQERGDENKPFRWAGPKSLLYFPKTTRTMRFEVAPDQAGRRPLAVTFRIGRQVYHHRFERSGWQTLTFYLPEHLVGRYNFLEIEFDSYWRANEIDEDSLDRRPLTVRFHDLFANLNAPDNFPPPGGQSASEVQCEMEETISEAEDEKSASFWE